VRDILARADDKRAREDELRERLREAVVPAFDRWGAKNLDVLYSKDDPESIQEARTVDLFMSKRVFVLGFMRYVTQEVTASQDSQRQRRTLVKASLLSILHEAGISTSELVEKPATAGEGSKAEGGQPPYYSRKRVQGLLRDVYRETFSELPQAHRGRKRVDSRLSNYSTVFSPYGEAELNNSEKVAEFQALDRLATYSNPELRGRIVLNSAISDVTPEHVKDMLAFRKLCSETMLEIGDFSELGKLLARELAEMTYTFEVFHAHVLSILSIEWFRSRREPEKHNLIERGFPLKYTEEDATEASALLHELTKGDGDWVVSILQSAAMAFTRYQMFPYSRIMFGRCLKLRDTDPSWKGVLHENIAVTYRMESKPKLMVQEMKTALSFYKEAGETYRACVALKNLREAEWMLGFPDLAREFFGEAESFATKLDIPARAAVIGNLAKASRRLGQGRMEIEYLNKFLETAPEDWSADILQASSRLGELTR
jgi:tetratricopeptide (TPR) repeat protein